MSRRVLIAEDEPVSRLLLRKQLENWGYEVTETMNGPEALRQLQHADAPSLAILDWMMPGMDGPEVVEHLRKRKLESYTYILLLTARTEKTDILLGLGAGADDYLTKPFDAQELQARLNVGARILDLQERLAAALAASEFRATHDALTGLYNRGTIMSILAREVNRASRQGTPLGLLLADLDHFKAINDTYGHSAGDEALIKLASLIQSGVRPYDSIGRYGGEEFLVIVPGCGNQETQHVAERLRESVAMNPISVAGTTLELTISVGASTAVHGEEINLLLNRADAALYEAKDDGRNRVRFRSVPLGLKMSVADEER